MNIIELFGGIGAPRKALESLGIKVTSDYVEIDDNAVIAYNAIFNENNVSTSVIDYKPEKNKKYELLFHGSPCQDFSMIGKKQGAEEGSGTRSSLLWESLRIVEEAKPQIVIWENVKSVTNKNNIHILNKYISKLKDLGYNSSYRVLNASKYGIPQKRERVFVVSILGNNNFNFDNIEEIECLPLNMFLQTNVEEKYFLTKDTEDRIRKWKSFQNPLKRVTNTNSLLPTLTTRSGFGLNASTLLLNDLDKIRVITELETWRLMGFNDNDYYKVKYRLQQKTKLTDNLISENLYKLSGNSIVVNVLVQLFKEAL